MNSATSITTRLLVALGAMLLVACNEQEQATAGPAAGAVECRDPRPEMCTQDYRPVCATRDTGVRCVTTPCDSTETATYSKGCMACADPAVYHYSEGACEK